VFYDRFCHLCTLKGVSPSRAGLDIGVSKTAVNGWKNGRAISSDNLQALAEYFEVSVDYLLGNTDIKTPSDNKEMIDDELIVLARRVGEVPEEDRKRIYKTFESTIDLYLEAINKDKKKG